MNTLVLVAALLIHSGSIDITNRWELGTGAVQKWITPSKTIQTDPTVTVLRFEGKPFTKSPGCYCVDVDAFPACTQLESTTEYVKLKIPALYPPKVDPKTGAKLSVRISLFCAQER